MIWVNIWLGSVLIVITIGIHSQVTRFLVYVMRKNRNQKLKTYIKEFYIAKMVLLLFAAAILESTFWAVTYIATGAIENFESALYFSIVTFTTLGYGDIILSESWRLLAAFEAATGIIIFGWSTAIVMAMVQRFIMHNNET